MFAAVPPLISTMTLVYSRRWDLLRFLRRLPRLCLAEVRYLATGIELDPLVQENHLSSIRPTLPRLQEVSVVVLGVSLSPIVLNSCSLSDQPPEGPRQSQVLTTSLPDSPVHLSPQREYASLERIRSPTPVVTDVPLAVVRDIIPALLRNKTTVDSVGLVCAIHKVSPPAAESIMQIVRENLSPARRQQWCVVSSSLFPRYNIP